MYGYGDFDSILCVINQNVKPFKKKNLHYLLSQHQDIVSFRDISAKYKCPKCRQARPWFIVDNVARGIFVVQKAIEFFEPWFSLYLQKSMALEELSNGKGIESIYLIITQVTGNGSALQRFYGKIAGDIIDEDIRFKNGCIANAKQCDNKNLWLILKISSRALNIIEEYKDILNPWFMIKGQIPLFKEMLPTKIIGVEKWTKRIESSLGHLKVQTEI
jgi:hypothetical protein